MSQIATTRAGRAEPTQPWARLAKTLVRGAQDAFEWTAAPLSRCVRGLHDAVAPPRPLKAAPLQWTYVPFRDTCDSTGTGPAGLSINPRPGAERLVIFLGGGSVGADGITCQPDQRYNAEEVANAWWTQGQGIFDRDDPHNPLADASYVVIPALNYDRHMGDHLELYTDIPGGDWTLCAHRGGANFKAFLRRIAPTFPQVKQVVLAGESAGGFGAAFQAPRVRKAFPGKELLILNDSGPYLPPGCELFNGAKVEAWGLRKSVPRGWERLLPSANNPQAGSWNLYGLTANLSLRTGAPVRTALITSVQDACIADSYRLSLPQFEQAVRALPALVSEQDPHARVFLVNWPGHTWLKHLPYLHDHGTRPVALSQFLGDFLKNAPTGHVAQAPWTPPPPTVQAVP